MSDEQSWSQENSTNVIPASPVSFPRKRESRIIKAPPGAFILSPPYQGGKGEFFISTALFSAPT
jgi:hypothetical protein